MKQYTLQSYFKSLCNSFYIAYVEVKRLERELKEADSTVEEENLENVKEVLKIMKDTESPIHKYINFKSTEPELEAEKVRLEQIIHQKDEKIKNMNEENSFWSEWMWHLENEIWRVLLKIERMEKTIIVTSKEEVYALMFVYRSEGLIPILNTKEQYLESFPKNNKVCSNFLKVYLSENEEKMKFANIILDADTYLQNPNDTQIGKMELNIDI